jgi:hypothetical protein
MTASITAELQAINSTLNGTNPRAIGDQMRYQLSRRS